MDSPFLAGELTEAAALFPELRESGKYTDHELAGMWGALVEGARAAAAFEMWQLLADPPQAGAADPAKARVLAADYWRLVEYYRDVFDFRISEPEPPAPPPEPPPIAHPIPDSSARKPTSPGLQRDPEGLAEAPMEGACCSQRAPTGQRSTS